MGAKRVEIYILKHPITKEIRYIGKANDSVKRLKGHLLDSKRRNTPIYCWIEKLSSEGLIPIVEVIKITDLDNWENDEINLIQEYKNKGFRLLNVALGGDEPFCSKEVRADNGRNVALAIHTNPLRKKLWQLKHDLGIALKQLDNNGSGVKANEIRNKLALRGIYFKTS